MAVQFTYIIFRRIAWGNDLNGGGRRAVASFPVQFIITACYHKLRLYNNQWGAGSFTSNGAEYFAFPAGAISACRYGILDAGRILQEVVK